MKRSFRQWLVTKWTGIDQNLAQAFNATFSTEYGQRVLKHLLDNVYCTIYEGTDPIAAALHSGRRSIVHEILENIDLGQHPDKYIIKEEENLSGRVDGVHP